MLWIFLFDHEILFFFKLQFYIYEKYTLQGQYFDGPFNID